MKAKYSIKKNREGSLENLIKDMEKLIEELEEVTKDVEYSEEKYKEQYSILGKRESTVDVLRFGVLFIMLMVVSVLIVVVFTTGFGLIISFEALERFMGGLIITLTTLLLMGATYNLIRNRRIKKEHKEWCNTIDKGRFIDFSKNKEVKYIGQRLGNNRNLLELYRLVEEQSDTAVEVYKVSVPIIPNKEVPEYMDYHSNLLFKEDNIYYQMATKDGSFLKLYLEEEPDTMSLQGNNIRQIVHE